MMKTILVRKTTLCLMALLGFCAMNASRVGAVQGQKFKQPILTFFLKTL